MIKPCKGADADSGPREASAKEEAVSLLVIAPRPLSSSPPPRVPRR